MRGKGGGEVRALSVGRTHVPLGVAVRAVQLIKPAAGGGGYRALHGAVVRGRDGRGRLVGRTDELYAMNPAALAAGREIKKWGKERERERRERKGAEGERGK